MIPVVFVSRGLCQSFFIGFWFLDGQQCANRPATMKDEYFDTRVEFEEVQRSRRQRMVKYFIGQQEEAVRPMLLEALRRDLEDLNIVIKLQGSNMPSCMSEVDAVDESVIQMILDHCPSTTREQAFKAMKAQNYDNVKAINMLQLKGGVKKRRI